MHLCGAVVVCILTKTAATAVYIGTTTCSALQMRILKQSRVFCRDDCDGLGIQLFHMKHIITKAIFACLTRFKVLYIPTSSCAPIYVEINGF